MNAMPMVARCARRQPIYHPVLCWICGDEKSAAYFNRACALCEIRKELDNPRRGD